MKTLTIILLIIVTLSTSNAISDVFIQNNNVNSIKFYQDLMNRKTGNFAFGIFPLEVSMALIYFGSKGDTALQIKTAFGWNSSDEQITKNFESTIKELKNIHHLHSSNRIFVSNSFDLNTAFLKKASLFDVDIIKVNFSATEETTKLINSWVENKTNKKVKNCIGEKFFTPQTDLVLFNNMYIEESGLHGLENISTENMEFHISKNVSVMVKTMKMTGYFMVSRHPTLGLNMVKLPFIHEKVYMLIVLADDREAVNSIEDKATQFWNSRKFTSQYMTLYLPKFQVASTIDIIPTLKKAGISNLFSTADLSGIADKISKVSIITQQTYVDVDKRKSASHDRPINGNHEPHEPDGEVFKVNHPFVFGILDENDLSVIFGRITEI